MDLHDQIEAIPGGELALAQSRLRRGVTNAIYSAGAWWTGPIGALRLDTLSAILHEVGYEALVTLVPIGQAGPEA